MMSGDKSNQVPQAFELRKSKILAELSIPDEEYTDLSPKGSVDEGIRNLIQDINSQPGLVTTSSCAGRISVFLEGRKRKDEQQPQEGPERQFAPSGGKGAGKWLYVSHEPMEENGEKGKTVHEVFGMQRGDGRPGVSKAPRLVRFHFEPLILHVMAATLHHAHLVLSAASSSGFRESGLQSLRCLDEDPDGAGPSPIVAVRSAGLSLESIIGYCEDNDDPTSEPVIRSLVTEEYLQMLVSISNERFSINTERKERFRSTLLQLCSADRAPGAKAKGKAKPPGWEDPEARKKRMREEGLERKRLLEAQRKSNDQDDAQNA